MAWCTAPGQPAGPSDFFVDDAQQFLCFSRTGNAPTVDEQSGSAAHADAQSFGDVRTQRGSVGIRPDCLEGRLRVQLYFIHRMELADGHNTPNDSVVLQVQGRL